MPDRKNKKNPVGHNSFLDDFVIIGGVEPEDMDADAQSELSRPSQRLSAGNEFNLEEGSEGSQSNEDRISIGSLIKNDIVIGEEEDEKSQHGIMPEKDIESSDDSFSLDKDIFGLPIISNKLPSGMKRGAKLSGSGGNLPDPKPLKGRENPRPRNEEPETVSALGPSWGYEEVAPESVAGVAPRRKRKAQKDNVALIFNEPSFGDPEGDENEDLLKEKRPDQIQQDGGYSFPAEHKPRTKVPVPRELYDKFTVIAGKTTAIPVTLAASPYLMVKGSVSSLKLASAKKNMQEKREHDVIPGWDGAKYKKTRTDTGAHILLDQRRVPTVWSRLTAGKAEDGNGNPTPPEVTVYFDQPKQASSQNMVGQEMGHSMLGIDYSRYSRFTNRYERYRMQYGFYMAGGFNNVASQNAMANRNALVPGELHDDYGHMYTVSRRYPATPAQVNSIVKASETYADGGYGYYSRNCTTFVKEMVVDVGKLDTGGAIFEKEASRYTLINNFFRWGGATIDAFLNTSMKSHMAKVSKQEDLSYQGYGNKRLTKEDLKHYNDTNSLFTLHPETYAPAVSAENARRLTGKKSGVLGSYKFAGEMGENVQEAMVGLQRLSSAVTDQVSQIAELVPRLLPPEQQDPDNGMPEQVLNTIQELYLMADSSIGDLNTEFDALREEQNKPDAVPSDLFSADRIRACRQQMASEMEKAANMYRDFFRADERLYVPFSNLLSIYELCLDYLDKEYKKADKAPLAQGDLGNIREEMSKATYRISAGNKEAEFTPTHYESYIQIYNDPKTAVQAYARYQELKARSRDADDEDAEEQENAGPRLSKEERQEFKKLSRMEALAQDFDSAHNYLLEKDAFTQQDIDYVFALKRKEQHGIRGQNNEMLKKGESAAGIYQSIFLEKIFGGMKQAWFGGEGGGGMPDKDFEALTKDPGPKNMKKLAKWLDSFLGGRTEQKQKGMKMIIKGIYRSAPGHTKDTIQQYMKNMVLDSYLYRIVKNDSSARGTAGSRYFGPAFSIVMGDKKCKFTKLIRSISGEVIDDAARKEKEARKAAKEAEKQKALELKAAQKAKKKK